MRAPGRKETADPEPVLVGPENLDECGIGCVADPKHPGFKAKTAWIRDRFAEGLRILMFRDRAGKPLAMLEFVPGEHAWRPVDAMGWLFVHCLWVFPRGRAAGGLGGRLVRACVGEARKAGRTGVAAVVSDGPWMAGKGIFLKNGFEPIAETGRFMLVALRLGKGPDPKFRRIPDCASESAGLRLVYADQCPMLAKSAKDLAEAALESGLDIEVTKLRSAREAQKAPSHYGVFSLLWNGRLVADHYVSKGRFRYILRDEIRR